ncbi:aminodeoxychorismate synthase component I [Sphingomonas morindae]|uniref:Probable branched-chain-amino-acid aminotransferase n=1 Tax=Sphingomonas morindae TaxID=1541170 RepID=A0ABY4XBL8_9SPHN|nr:aminodeoxychorismate synthase component I [Sphingomonas morindae]USI74151.1 aminodeoxychorismate synthase component I [Sphingomonas morindae]
MLDPASCFVLLDDASGPDAAPARLYQHPRDQVIAHAPEEIPAALARLRAARHAGLHAAGYCAYEAGPFGDGAARPGDGAPLLWFGLFDGYRTIASDAVPALLPDGAGAWASPPAPLIDRDAYIAAVARIQAWIAAGDIYQANLTFAAALRIVGDPLALYARIRRHAAAGWGGIIRDGTERLILSFSPELFFRLDQGRITARPMKGTAPRGVDAASDAEAARALARDPKQRAENLMIVDLLRNDLARVAVPGSVAVPALFTVERYPTLHQLTSTVTAALAPGLDAVAVLEAAFPCGSITGAPKLRAIALTQEVESAPRGLYTGAIGRIDADGDAAFNVAIRTLVVTGEAARLGLGSGIVADSHGAAEWRECRAKGEFVSRACPPFDLLETMRFDPFDGLLETERHLARLKASAEALGFAVDRHAVRNELQAATFRLREPARVRVRAAPSGRVAIEVRALPATPAAPVAVAIVPLPVAPEDFRLRHKTSARDFYDEARRAAGCFEVVFARSDGWLTEGSFTSLFVERDGRLLTPPLAHGLLPGILRQALLESGRAIEAPLRAEDLRDGFLLGNAVRGLIQARLNDRAP